MPPRPEVIAQFTDDGLATKDRVCDRYKKCRSATPVIRKGENIYHITSRDPTVPGRFVCEACYLWYVQQPTTTVRPITGAAAGRGVAPGTGSHQHVASAPPNAALIRQSVNAGQRGCRSGDAATMDAPSIVPIPRGPIQASHPHNRTRGPVIATPGTSSGQAPGYSSNHAHYSREREHWAQAAARPATVPVNTISLKISAVYEGSKRGEPQGISFGNIKEGRKAIDALINAQGLIHLARDTIVPKVKAFCPDFPWDDSEFVVRDAGWVDLSTHDQSEAYFYDDCVSYHPKTLKPIFKSKCFALMVVVPASQWLKYQTFLEDSERENLSSRALARAGRGLTVQSTAQGHTVSHSRGDTQAALFLPEVGPAPAADSTVDRALSAMLSKKRGHQYSFSSDSVITNGAQPASKKATSSVATHATTSKKITSAVVTQPTPQVKKAVVAAVVSPPRDAIRQALEKGGTANVDVNLVINHVAETIAFHPISLCPFDEILKDCMQSDAADNRTAWQLDPMGGLVGQLAVNKSQKGLVGIGAFKTAHDGVLSLALLASSGLGSEPRQKVVVKQPFFRSRSPTGKVNIIQRYTLSTDLSKLFREANILYWAKSLLDLTYTFIDAAIESSDTTPAFNVPRLRFVHAGPALVQSSASKSTTGVYLVEEKILCSRDEFVKFIHNRDFGPSIESDEDGYDIAEFLVFTQHVQYMKTKGLAFISDYQGSSSLLTDPQILTDSSLGVGQDMFGDGNLTSGVKMFKEQHICNHYCRWPGFGLKAFARGSESEGGKSH